MTYNVFGGTLNPTLPGSEFLLQLPVDVLELMLQSAVYLVT